MMNEQSPPKKRRWVLYVLGGVAILIVLLFVLRCLFEGLPVAMIFGIGVAGTLFTVNPIVCYPWSIRILRRKGYAWRHAFDGATALSCLQLLGGSIHLSALLYPAIPTLIVCALLKPKAPEDTAEKP